MSYILDALKKAEAQRHLGGVPSIHAAASSDGATLEAQPFWRKHLPWLITGFLALALMIYVLWSQPWRHAEPAPVAVAPASASVAVPVTAAPTEQPRPAPVQETPPPAAPSHAAPAVTAEKPAHTAPPAAPAPIDTPKAETAASAAKPAPTPAAPAATTPAASTPPTPPAAPEDEVGTAQDLPAAIQRELPPAAITGYIYARNPADRSALINKRLLHEGEIVSPDLVLEKLTPRGVIMNYKGYRYRVPY